MRFGLCAQSVFYSYGDDIMSVKNNDNTQKLLIPGLAATDIRSDFKNIGLVPEEFRKYQCYPEIMLLTYALRGSLWNYEDQDQNIPKMVLLLAKMVENNNLDKYFEDISSWGSEYISAYKAFKTSPINKQQEAVAILYERRCSE